MSRKEKIRYYDESDNFLYWVTEEEAIAAKQRREVDEFYERRGDGAWIFMGVKPIAANSDNANQSPPQITASENKINAGICDEWVTIGRVRSVKTKIKWYQRVGSEKSPERKATLVDELPVARWQ